MYVQRRSRILCCLIWRRILWVTPPLSSVLSPASRIRCCRAGLTTHIVSIVECSRCFFSRTGLMFWSPLSCRCLTTTTRLPRNESVSCSISAQIRKASMIPAMRWCGLYLLQWISDLWFHWVLSHHCVATVTASASRQSRTSLTPALWPNTMAMYSVYTLQKRLLSIGWRHMAPSSIRLKGL